jgi:hypothetical protein
VTLPVETVTVTPPAETLIETAYVTVPGENVTTTETTTEKHTTEVTATYFAE